MSFQENILNRYASWSYNFKLYVISRTDYNDIIANRLSLREIHKYPFKKQAVICETGATNLKINELSIESTPIPTEGTVVSKINFDVTQAKGFSLPESITTAGVICGWNRLYAEPVMLLEISFKGWSHDLPARDGIRYDINIDTITIPIKITNIGTSLDSGGARYNVEAMYGYDFMRDDISEVSGTFTIDGCTKLADFGAKFAEELNSISRSDKTKTQVEPTLHAFVFEDGIGDFDLQVPESGEVPINNVDLRGVESGPNGVSYTISSGARIPKVIEGVLATSEMAQKELKIDEEEDIIGRTFYIQPRVILNDDNVLEMGHASKTIIWFVGLRATPLPRNNFDGRSEEAYQKIIGSDLSNYSKQYKYYFSGENTDVVSADIDYQNLYLNKISRYENLFANPANTGMGITRPSLDVDNIRKNQETSAERDRYVQKFEKMYSDERVVYVDSVDTASVASLTAVSNKYQYGKHNHATSVSQGVGGQAQRIKALDHQLTLRNIRNQLALAAIKMKLEIRGDPYWLAPFDPTIDSEGVTYKQFNLINFIMGFPNENQERGIREDYTFSGIYMVNSVTSTFSSGSFKQRLDCVRLDPITGDVSVKKAKQEEKGE